jgi:hypothetical protein
VEQHPVLLPVPRFEKIFEKNKEKSKKVYKTVTIQDKKFSIVDNDGNKALKMDEIRGSSALNLDKEMAKYMEGSYDVSIESDIYTPPSKGSASDPDDPDAFLASRKPDNRRGDRS